MVTFTQITKEDVDSFEMAEREIPSCQLRAEWTGQDKQPSQLTYKVTLEGAKAPDNYFCIVLESAQQDTTMGARSKLVVALNYFTIHLVIRQISDVEYMSPCVLVHWLH